jgi:hypothetical protein
MHCVCPTKNAAYTCIDAMRCISLPKRVRLTKLQELQVCRQHSLYPDWKHRELSDWAHSEFGLAKAPSIPTISKMLKREARLREMPPDFLGSKKAPSAARMLLETFLVETVLEFESRKVAMSGGVLRWLAREYADYLGIPVSKQPKFTKNGWQSHFMARYGLTKRRGHGEIGSVDIDAARRKALQLRAEIGRFHPDNVFNMDEAAFFFRQTPKYSITLKDAPSLKQKKDRLTMVVATNSSGTEKLPLIFLGKAKTPRWLDEKPAAAVYDGTAKGWMTVKLFQQWLKMVDEVMAEKGRHILLLLDNAPVHKLSEAPEARLTNVTVKMLPPNTTAAIQPMDQGVIAWMKQRFIAARTQEAALRLLDGDADPYTISPAEALEWMCDAWEEMPPEDIKKYWSHAGLYVDRSAIADLLN